MSLASALERAAEALPEVADAIRPANGDPHRLLANLEVPEAIRVLTWLLDQEIAAGGELVETWLAEDDGHAAILALEGADLSKAARKVIRKAHHALRSRGVELPEEEPKARVATIPKVEEGFSTAAVTPIDPTGARMLYLVEPHPSGGSRLFEVAGSNRKGVMGVRVYSAGRSKVRSFLKELTGRALQPGAEAPVEQVKALVARVVAAHPKDRPLPPSLTEWRSHLMSDGSETAPTPGDQVAEALGDPGEVDLERAVDLARQASVGPWPPDPQELEALAQRIRDKLEGPLVLTEAQQREQAAGLIDEGLEELFGGTAAAQMSAQYREAAYIQWKREDEESARVCLAAARAFAEDSPVRNPVARFLVETPLASVMPQAGGEPESSGESLLVTP